MKFCRFNDNKLGLVEGDEVLDVSEALKLLPAAHYPVPLGDILIKNLFKISTAAASLATSAKRYPLAQVKLLSPVANPSKIIAAPINYQSHIDLDLMDQEIAYKHTISHISQAGLFLKATSSLAGPGEGFEIQFPDRRNDHEIELVVVIGKRCRSVDEAESLSMVAGYAIGLDMTVRGPEDRSFRKSHDSYSIVGPYLVTPDEVPDPANLNLRLSVNGELRQEINTSELVYGVRRLIAYASETYTLYPGDILFTGTPHGVGPVTPGDEIECSISGIGHMRVEVRNCEN